MTVIFTSVPTAHDTAVPTAFDIAVAAVRSAKIRQELDYREIPPPAAAAPQAIALAASINNSGHGVTGSAAQLHSPTGTGRLILLHDLARQRDWGNSFRFVCYAQADMDADIGSDPLLADVAWSWLEDALTQQRLSYSHLAGTTTKTISNGFGSLAATSTGSQLQLRASWTPRESNLEHYAAHVTAWSNLVCLLGGLPHAEGVVAFSPAGGARAQLV